jgi:hypothetical protein
MPPPQPAYPAGPSTESLAVQCGDSQGCRHGVSAAPSAPERLLTSATGLPVLSHSFEVSGWETGDQRRCPAAQ